MKNLIHTVIIAGLTLGAATISQASVFTTSETAPIAGSVLISNDTASTKNMTARINGVNDGGSSLSDRTLGQSFTSSVAGSINAISVQLGGGYNNNPANTNNFSALVAGKGNLLLNVFDMTNAGTSLTAIPVVYDMAGQDLSGLNYSYVTFELGETLTIDANIEYGFEFGWDPAYIADSDDTIYRNFGMVRTAGGNAYGAGEQIGKNAYTSFPNIGINSGVNGNDLDFFVHTVSSVPEPSTYALLAGFLALSSVMVRRRR